MDYGTVMKSQWKLDFMEISKDDHSRGYRATGVVVECSLCEGNYAQSVNEWLKPDGLQPEMDDNRSIVSIDGSWHDINHDQMWNDDQGWMTQDRSQEMHHGRQMSINPIFHINKLTLCNIWCSGSFTLQSMVPSNTQSTIHRFRSVYLYAQVPRRHMF